MPEISFKKNIPSLNVPSGANLMESLLSQGIPVASSCLGDGICGKCKVNILKGNENLNAENETEKILKSKYDLGPLTRISCQTEVMGDITVDTAYW